MLLPKPGNCSGIRGLRYIRLKGCTRYMEGGGEKTHNPHHDHKSLLNSHLLLNVSDILSQSYQRTNSSLFSTYRNENWKQLVQIFSHAKDTLPYCFFISSKICPFKSQDKNSVAQHAANSYSHLHNLFQKIRMALKEGNAA